MPRASVPSRDRDLLRFESEITTYVTMVRLVLGAHFACAGTVNSEGTSAPSSISAGEERSDRESMESAIEKCKAAEEVAWFLAGLCRASLKIQRKTASCQQAPGR